MGIRKQKDKKITEKMVEAIYNESQRKVATDPHYAEAFGRAICCFRKLWDNDGPLIGQDKEQLDKAFGDLMLIDLCKFYGVDPPGPTPTGKEQVDGLIKR